MTNLTRPETSAAMDLSDSLDIRLIVAGRLSPTNVALRRDRAALKAILGDADRVRTATTTHPDGTAR